MAANDEAKAKAMAAVQAIFDRYDITFEQFHAFQRSALKTILFVPSNASQLRCPQTHQTHQDFDYDVMKSLKLLDAGPEGSVLYEMKITERYSNLNDVMHGGAAGVIF
ncbi:hypothetical protein LTS18_007117, partial [Coniosporium uncinatum]